MLKGRELPQWILEEPEVMPGEEFYLRAFWDLTSERQLGQGVMGRIPWSRAMDYAVREGVEPDMLDSFWRILYGMDSGYLGLQREEFDKATLAQRSEQRSTAKRYGR